MKKETYVTSTWLSRDLSKSLENYKKQQAKVAESKGRTEELKAAKTLTQARKAIYGEKRKVISGWKGHEAWQNEFKSRNNAPGGRNY